MNAPTAMLYIDPINNTLIKVNKKGEVLFQLSNKNLSQHSVTKLFSPCIEQLLPFTQQVINQGSAWTSDLSTQVSNNVIHLEINASYFDGNILLSCQNSEISFKRYHQAIVESNFRSGLSHWHKNETIFEEIERHNQLLLTAVGDGIYGVDNNGKTTFVNKAAEHITGWKREDLIGKKIHDVMHYSHPDGSHYHAHECPIYAAFNDGEIHSIDDEVFWSKEGKPIPVEYTSTPLTENGLLIGAVVVFRDITERKYIQTELLHALKEVDALKRRLEMENAYLLEEINADFNHHIIIGQSNNVKHMIQQISLVSPTNANVLITGESGTGKELIARAIHEESERKSRPLIRVNCAAIPADLFESEFFGHVKGAFSGAISTRLGRFELADGATIFLDEVGEIPLLLQGKLLRVLQEQQFERVGESQTRHVDVRVISATNQNLKQLVKENKFREDLYFRLNVFPIHSPALRDRPDDIPLLAQHFIRKICQRLNQTEPPISIAQMQYLTQYNWPGNIRELENIIERQLILGKGKKINFEFLANASTPQEFIIPRQQETVTANGVISAKQHKASEKHNLMLALTQSKGKIYGENGAAELLGLRPTTLSSKLKKYGINRQEFSLESTSE